MRETPTLTKPGVTVTYNKVADTCWILFDASYDSARESVSLVPIADTSARISMLATPNGTYVGVVVAQAQNHLSQELLDAATPTTETSTYAAITGGTTNNGV